MLNVSLTLFRGPFLLAGTAKDSIFYRPSQPDQLYKLRDSIKFHLFINTAPCGDARIFSPHETEIGVDKHPNRCVFIGQKR